MSSVITAFTYKKKLKFDTSAAGANVASNQVNFPVCVHINSSSWVTAGERTAFFDTWNINGKRCQFFDSDGVTNLPYEVEYYNSGTPEAVYWVKVPQIDGNSITDYIWVAFGNDPNSADQDNKANVWDSNYVGVYPMYDSDTTHTPDISSGTAYNAAKYSSGHPAQATGEAGYGEGFPGAVNNGLTVAANTKWPYGSGAYTYSLWVYPTSFASVMQILARGTNATDKMFLIGVQIAPAAGELGVWHYGDDWLTSGAYLTLNAWNFVAVSYDGSKEYINLGSAAQLNRKPGGAFNIDSAKNIYLGRHDADSGDIEWLSGYLDQVEVSNVCRTADYICLKYFSLFKTNFNGDSWLSWDAAHVTVFHQSLSGTLTPSGVLAKKTKKALAGTLTSSGTLGKKISRMLSGSISPTGSIAKKISRALAGQLTTSGTLGHARKFTRVLSGTLFSSGTISRKTSKRLAGTVSSSGGITKKTSKSLAGTLAPSGVLSRSRRYYRVLSGTVSMSGTLAKKTSKRLTGVITPVGTLSAWNKKLHHFVVITAKYRQGMALTTKNRLARYITAKYRQVKVILSK